MTIELELDIEEAMDLHARLSKGKPMTDAFNALLLDAVSGELDNENERQWERHEEEKLNPDNDSADLAYRRGMIDAGRGHQVR